MNTKMGIVKGVVERFKGLAQQNQLCMKNYIKQISLQKNGYPNKMVKKAKRNKGERSKKLKIDYKHTVTFAYSGILTGKTKKIMLQI